MADNKDNFLNLKPNEALLEKGIALISKQTGGKLSVEELKSILEKNGFNGIFVVNDEQYGKLYGQEDPYIGLGENTTGCYLKYNKSIIIRKKNLSNKIVKHELIHALIDYRLSKTIDNDGVKVTYGNGFEEGLAALSETMNEKEGLDSRALVSSHSAYGENARLLIILDYLYKLDKNKKYPNLLILAIKEPENFLSTIYNTIYDIIEYALKVDNEHSKTEKANLAYKTAFQTLSFADYQIDKIKDENYSLSENEKSLRLRLYTILVILLTIKDKRIRKGNYPVKYEKWISKKLLDSTKIDEKKMSSTERLMYMLYGNESYNYNMACKIDGILSDNYCYFDSLDEENKMKL